MIKMIFGVSIFALLSACSQMPAGWPANNPSDVNFEQPCKEGKAENAQDKTNYCVKACVYKKNEDLKYGEEACSIPKRKI